MTEYLIFDWAFLVAAIISGYLSLHLFRKYQQEKMTISLWFLLLFAFSTLGYLLTWYGLSSTASYDDIPLWVSLVSNTVLIGSSSLAFAISLLLWKQDNRLLIIPFVIAIIDLSIVIYALIEPSMQDMATIIRVLGLTVVSAPVLVVFFYLYLKTNSGKSLSFSVAWLVLLVGGFSGRFLGMDVIGIALIISAIILLLGMVGFVDRVILRNPT
ncbi:hypothetical protein CEE45_02825 [Candidatus Heimdallarchaeota archaeon B3_Heim]|nr:MAG: hypothetical protein CEE45_02825 [Candidatus Heimdallarchaeota archaeon B3_Heim]